MKPPYAHRFSILGLLLVVIVSVAFSFSGLVGYGFGCGLGGDHLECALIPNVLWFFVICSTLLSIVLLAALIKPFFSAKKLNLLVGIYILFIALIFLAFVLFQSGGPVHTVINGTEFECHMYNEGTFAEDVCYTSLAKRHNNIEYCKKTQHATDCYKHFAVKQRDPSLCFIGDDYCVIAIAVSEKDASVCEKIENEYTRQQCFAQLAELTKDITLCEKSHRSFPFCKIYIDTRNR